MRMRHQAVRLLHELNAYESIFYAGQLIPRSAQSAALATGGSEVGKMLPQARPRRGHGLSLQMLTLTFLDMIMSKPPANAPRQDRGRHEDARGD
jgi:hypothetical protein